MPDLCGQVGASARWHVDALARWCVSSSAHCRVGMLTRQHVDALHDIGPGMKNCACKEMKESNAKGGTIVDGQPGRLVARERAL